MSLSKQQVADSISFGTIKLPAGKESASGILSIIFIHLDVNSLLKVVESSLLKQLCVAFNSREFLSVRHDALKLDYAGCRRIMEIIHHPKQYYLLCKRYKDKFPKGTPLVCACQNGPVEDVVGMIRGARAVGMDVTAMVNEIGKTVNGNPWTPLMAAAPRDSTINEILLENGADTATFNEIGWNALHTAATWSRTTTTVQLLLNNMKLEDINRKAELWTPLDQVCLYNHSSIRQQLIGLIRQKGGKRASEL